jgi:hypothetical protein
VLPHFYLPGSSAANPVPTGLVSAPADVLQPRFTQDSNLDSMLTFDMAATGAGITDTKTFFDGGDEAFYVTTDHLYVVSNYYSAGAANPYGSIIQRFDMNGDGVTPGPAGFVPGLVTGQYALDEFNGDLRVAAQTYFASPQDSTMIYVFQQNGTALNVVGSLQGIGPGEGLNTVRFAGNYAYLSGILTTPSSGGSQNSLLAVDLTDPADPTLAGQDLSTGQNDYLQVLDGNELLGIGYDDSDENGSYSLVELTLYNLSDPQNPSIIDQIDVPDEHGAETFSPADSNPSALAYSLSQNLLAIPVTGTALTLDGDASFNDLIYQIDLQTGFHLIGSVTQDSQVDRSIFQGDLLYSIADSSVKVQQIIQATTPGSNPALSIGPSLEVRFTGNLLMVQNIALQTGGNLAFQGPVLYFGVSDPTGLVATIGWGDGTTSTGTIEPSDLDLLGIVGQHTYGADGEYAITVTFTQNGESSTTTDATIQVGDVDPQVEFFLQRLYSVLLNRQIDQTALDYWAADLSQGLSRAFIVQFIMQSPEYQSAQVEQLYKQWLGRPADAAGLAAWLQFLAAGHSLDDVRAGILSSQEFFADTGSTAAFVSALYVDLLGRQADPEGQLAWQSALLFGLLSRQQAATLIAHSHEAAVYQVMLEYQQILGRPAELGGLLYFTDALQSGSNPESVEAAIFGSAEYFQK